MLHLSDQGRFFLFGHPTDMRKSFRGLAAIVVQHMKQDVLNGDVYIFFSKRRHVVKLLRFEGDGFAIFYKQLEKGTYELPPANPDTDSVVLTSNELGFILKGIVLRKIPIVSSYTNRSASGARSLNRRN